MDPKLLEMLVCPVTKGPLVYDRENLVDVACRRVAAGHVDVVDLASGNQVHEPLEGDGPLPLDR